jgi:protein-S-isoprenylcysteine O-methyltransferase Ste14
MDAISPGHVATTGVIAGWLIVALAMVIGRRPSSAARVRHRSVAGIAGLALQGAGFALVFGWGPARLGSAPVGWLIAAGSAVLAVGSAVFMLAAVRTLGKQWSLLPRLVEEHTLIERGPYSIVRHPIYTAMLGLLVATGIALGRSSAVAIAAALYGAGTVIRIRLEERLLIQVFGGRYSTYSSRVPAFLPIPRRWYRRSS